MGLSGSKGITRPGEAEKAGEKDEDEVLDNVDAFKFRSVAARANYLTMDRPDIMFATKEICRKMPTPTCCNEVIEEVMQVSDFMSEDCLQVQVARTGERDMRVHRQ